MIWLRHNILPVKSEQNACKNTHNQWTEAPRFLQDALVLSEHIRRVYLSSNSNQRGISSPFVGLGWEMRNQVWISEPSDVRYVVYLFFSLILLSKKPKQLYKTKVSFHCRLFNFWTADEPHSRPSSTPATFIGSRVAHLLVRNSLENGRNQAVKTPLLGFVLIENFIQGCYSETAWTVILSVLWRRHNYNWSLPFCADLLIYEINYWV